MNHATEIVVHPIDTFEGVPEGPDAEPMANWVTLRRFEVQVNQRSQITAPVYANGRQQVPVEIIIEARDSDGVEVQLSTAQLKSIKLINYNTNTAVVGCKHDKDARFIYHWAPVKDQDAEDHPDEEVPADAPGATAQAIMIYVDTTDVSTSKIAAEITSPSGGLFRTNTPNPGPGKFDSWINIRGEEEIRYYASDMTMELVNEVTNDLWDVDLYYIRFTKEGLSIVDSIHYDVAGGEPHLNKSPHLFVYRFHMAFAVGGVRTITYAGHDGKPAVTFQVNKRPGQATAARCQSKMFNYYPERRHEACMRYYNQYGNYASCALGNTYTNGYNVMTLESSIHG
ncbi:hypothetical protein [Stenotrophomonas sp. PS02300]|uniref:hypothetical protein n=1 Tax=Stenotrophomonas sp. PS02300 TaxID=2991426 RepID=UPI00249A3247|nr:hypothetical protein [Stenotrophomonas sp. PS02300]